MSDQCNTCGGFEKLQRCAHCPTTLCEHCKLRHEPYCEEIQKRKKRGEGPTIANAPVPLHRHGHETPEPVWAEKVGEKTTDANGNVWTNAGKASEIAPYVEKMLTAPLNLTVVAAPETSHYRRFVDDADILTGTKLDKEEDVKQSLLSAESLPSSTKAIPLLVTYAELREVLAEQGQPSAELDKQWDAIKELFK